MSVEHSGLGAIALLAPALRQSAPLMLAAMGGIMSERVGVINIALEGMMLVGAFVGMWVGQDLGLLAGLATAVASGAILGLIHVGLTQRLRLNHVVSGVAINILALHGTTFLLRSVFNQGTPPRQARLDGTIAVEWFVGAAFVLPVALHYLLQHTRVGLRMRAVGESAESARMAGVSPIRLRVTGVLMSGGIAALAGAYLSMSQVGRFSDDMVSGRGFIALAAVVCGRWSPLGAAAAALAFGALDALQLQLQGTVSFPPEALRSMPYVLTIVAALALRPRPPADLGKNEDE